MNILVTGGCGFIGANFIKNFLTNSSLDTIINLDKQTYAGRGQNLEHLGLANHLNYKFIKGDLVNSELVNHVFQEYSPDLVFNFAAESHVDRSIETARPFFDSNVIGAVNIFEAAKKYNTPRIIHISTDEIYGSRVNGSFSEGDKLNPASPYSSSKAAAELIAFSYFQTYKLPVIVTRSANNYGPYQFPEKLLPLFITNLIDKKQVPLMWSSENPGLNVRDWLHVDDNCKALLHISQHGNIGEVYNIPGNNEKTNIDMTKKLLHSFGYDESMIKKVTHRQGHDFRYSISGNKLERLGFKYKHDDLDFEIQKLVEWYQKNESWWRPLKNE